MISKFINKNNNPHKKVAFTLAEVLITLGIIGVVAAMTIPNLMQNQREKQTVVALKKAYSTWSNAYRMATVENGSVDNWFPAGIENMDRVKSSDAILDVLKKHVKLTKICSGEKGCFTDVVYKKIDGMDSLNFEEQDSMTKFITADGMNGLIYGYYGSSEDLGGGMYKNAYGALMIDVNGFKKPNIVGEDAFSFIITDQGIIPYGKPYVTATDSDGNNQGFPNACNRTKCNDAHCEACAAWVIDVGNMDYLHCDGLSWEGKHSCKEK